MQIFVTVFKKSGELHFRMHYPGEAGRGVSIEQVRHSVLVGPLQVKHSELQRLHVVQG